MTIRKWLPAILCAVVLSFLVGWATKNSAPNPPPTPNIVLRVLPTGKIYLVPKTGDIIKWVRDDKKPVHIHFPHNDRPCSEPDRSDTCTVSSAKGLFNYSCRFDSNDVMCQDPGIDPNSGSDGTVIRQATNPAGARTSAAGASLPKNITAMDIGCEANGTLSVIDPNTDSSSSSPTIDHGSTIQWTAHALMFSVSILSPANACVDMTTVGQGRVQWCDSPATTPPQSYTVTYQVSVSGTGACTKNNPGKFSFIVK